MGCGRTENTAIINEVVLVIMGIRTIIFHDAILGGGGNERITLEEEKYLSQMGVNISIITSNYNQNIFSGAYKPRVEYIVSKKISKILPIKILHKVVALRRKINQIRPDKIICVGEEGCVYLLFATIFRKYSYSAHIPQTMFWNTQTYGDNYDNYRFLLGRYSYVFRSVYNEIRNNTCGHKESLPSEHPKLAFKKKILSEVIGICTFLAVRKAKSIFVHSRKMAWEIGKMYKRKAIVLKGAFPEKAINYHAEMNIKETYRILDKKIILSVCRLESKKRVDLIIKAFNMLARDRKDIALLIGGTGAAENDLKCLVNRLGLGDLVIFTGFIDDKKLFDYYSGCDVFVSADHADFDITSYMALGFQKKVVWSTENEIDDELVYSNMVFPAEVVPSDFARAIECALDSKIIGNFDAKKYSWESYFTSVYAYVIEAKSYAICGIPTLTGSGNS
jgi:glycosyltransferase involved in cell wall biosynthesis